MSNETIVVRTRVSRKRGRYGDFESKPGIMFLRRATVREVEGESYAPTPAAPATPPQPLATVGEVKGILDLFEFAAQHLKRRKIRLALPGGERVVLKVAGNRARKPGTIDITDGGPYGSNVWHGRILLDGTVETRRGQSVRSEVMALLRDLAQDPVGVATAHGRMTGECCFCGLKLGEGKDQRSKDVGYGPDCAKHYGLPWGNEPAAEARAEVVGKIGAYVEEKAEEAATDAVVADELGDHYGTPAEAARGVGAV